MKFDKKKRIGRLLTQSIGDKEGYDCYIPKPLPPDPAIQTQKLFNLLDKATISLTSLKEIKANTDLFIKMFAKKEALLSSQIEGSKSSFSDILLASQKEAPKAKGDTKEILNYIQATNHGLKRIKSLPLARSLICEIHKKLLSGVRGNTANPGEFRRSQNWIGGTRPGNATFVPPPHMEVSECFSNLEKFINDDTVPLPILIKTAIAHVQFETIHPFLDGNGRVGRLLIPLMLYQSGLLSKPLLYLSLYFKQHRKKYYELLQKVRHEGDWETWIEFFLDGIHETSTQAFNTAKKISHIFEEDGKKISSSRKETVGVLKTFSYLKDNPQSNIKQMNASIDLSSQTIARSLNTLEKLKIVRKQKGSWPVIFIYSRYFKLLEESTKPT